MSDENVIVKAGKIFVFSSGEYSDFGYEGHFLALEEITTETFQSVVELLKADLAAGKLTQYGHPVDASEDWSVQYAIKDSFIARLVTTGKVMALDCEEVHIGSYGRLEISGVSS